MIKFTELNIRELLVFEMRFYLKNFNAAEFKLNENAISEYFIYVG